MEILYASDLPYQILASSSGDDDGSAIAFLLLFSGIIFYLYVFFRYRNADKRHLHETETPTTRHSLEQADVKVDEIRGASNPKTKGANNTEVRGSQLKGWLAPDTSGTLRNQVKSVAQSLSSD